MVWELKAKSSQIVKAGEPLRSAQRIAESACFEAGLKRKSLIILASYKELPDDCGGGRLENPHRSS